MNSLKTQIFVILTLMIMSCALSHGINYQQNCGERPRDIRRNRIIGGVNTFYGEVPWQVLLLVRTKRSISQCGAVLIDQNWILTAAHCLYAKDIQQMEAFFGKHTFISEDIEKEVSDNSKDDSNNTKRYAFMKWLTNDYPKPYISRNASKFIVNENFDSITFSNDIALIKLNQSVTNEDNIQPICLPKQMENFEGEDGYISGFGVLEYGSKRLPRVLQIVSVPILTNDYCNYLFEELGHMDVVKYGILCAGAIDGGRDACAGDSGGPLTVKRSEDNKWVLAGIISNGIECGQPNTPGVYTQVSAYVDWINAVINRET